MSSDTLSVIFDGRSNKTFLNSEHNMAVIKPLLDLLNKCNFDPSDLHVENWGRTKDGNLVIIDLGGWKLR
ncbi:MAG: hypothetical protein HC899_37750 [Leptolyngbyaceae cyanobacterium SM1_4_3]|nr:hypothetical protein [Leptolyngbyaceae cyanobacterium SM1_4_3]